MDINNIEVKRCSKCLEDKNAKEDFAKKYNGKSTICKQCHREYTKAHYIKNNQLYKDKHLVYKSKISLQVAEYLTEVKSKPCVDCKKSYPPYVMDFDHIKGKKDGNVSRMAAQKYTVDRIKTEIAKCELVCANCHRERTHNRKHL